MGAVLLHGLVPKSTARHPSAPPHDRLDAADFLVLCSPAPAGFADLQPDALADLALRHNAILQAYCNDTPVLPLRFGTAFSCETVALTHLNSRAKDHLRALNCTATFKEYSIRLSLLSQPPPTPLTEPASGRDFLTRGRQVRDHRRTLSDNRIALARDLLSHLRQFSLQIKATGVPKPDRLLDATLLVPPQMSPVLAALILTRQPQAAALGLDLGLTGPWPAYSFDPENPPAYERCDVA